MGRAGATTSIEDPSQPEWLKYKSLRELELIRETKKDHILNQMLADSAKSAHSLHAVPGHLSFFKYTLHNAFNTKELFSIVVNDPDEPFTTKPELQLVSDPAEWRHFCQ